MNATSEGSQVALYRPDLIDTLAAALGGEAVHTGHRCISFTQDEHAARVVFDNGVTAEADAVVGADGIHSALQRYVVEPRPPVFSGRAAYRGVVPADRLPDWPRRDAVLWTGEGKHFLTLPVRAGELRYYVGFVPADEHMRESWSAPGDPAALAAEFSGWDPQLAALLREVDTTFRWGLYDREPLPHWTRGRLTLLGDAAHAMLPHMGQGANQAIEDGMALAVLVRGLDTADVPGALIRYEELRRSRTALIQQGSRNNGQHLDSGNADMGETPSEDYDVEAAAEALR
jgi:salicylate hydroxylase